METKKYGGNSLSMSEKNSKKAYKKVQGQKIRRQYFNAIIYTLLGIIPIIAVISGGYALKTGTFSFGKWFGDLGICVYTLSVFLLPLVLLSVCNRFLFGKTVCVLNEKEIWYEGGHVTWSDVSAIEYEASLPSRGSSRGYSYACVICKDNRIIINQAPLYMLRQARKYASHIETCHSKSSRMFICIMIGITVVVPVIICLVK